MNQMTEPATADIGDRIAHDLLPGFVMTINDSKPCETDGARPVPHEQYHVTDPEGAGDWLCAYDIHRVA
jgi:hypothetical protein